MALGLTRSGRSKSTSDILDEIVQSDDALRDNSFHVENKYRTYASVDGFADERKCLSKEVKSVPRSSQNFVKKLIASLEKKNEACKANDEFFSKYYKRNDYSNPNTDFSYDHSKFQRSELVKTSGKEILNSRVEKIRRDPSFRVAVLPKDGARVLPRAKVTKQFSPDNRGRNNNNFDNPEHEFSSTEFSKNGKMVQGSEEKYFGHSYVGSNLQMYFDINGNDERRFNDSSSFDPNKSRVELENRRESMNFCFLARKVGKDDRRRSTLERIFKNSREEENSGKYSFNGTPRKKANRSKSFKDFFGSMIKWKKSEKQDGPRRFLSCDHLLEETETFGTGSGRKLPRVTSFQAMVFQDCEEDNLTTIKERKATIRPIYGGKRNEQYLVSPAKKKENRKFFATGEMTDDLVKPSAVKDIAKHLTPMPQKPRINDHVTERRKLLVEKNY